MLTAEAIMNSYIKMGYDAVAVAGNDLTGGEQFIKQEGSFKFPWVSANVFDVSGKLIFKPYLLQEVSGLTIGIVGLTESGTYRNDNIIIRDWQEPLQLQIEAISGRTDMIIILSNLPFSDNVLIGKTHPEIDMIIAADKKRGNLIPQLSGNALMTQTVARGKYLGRLTIKFHPDGKWAADTRQATKFIQNKLNSVAWQINQLSKKQTQPGQKISTVKLTKLRAQKNELELQLHNEESNSGQTGNGHGITNNYKADFIAIRPRAQQSQEINLLIAELKEKINIYQKQGLQNKNSPSKKNSAKNIFTGHSACKECHTLQTEFWQSTQHAKGYTTLVNRKESLNVECLPCHVTSNIDATSPYSERIALLSLPQKMKTIGCEVCHGPGIKHIVSPSEEKLIKRPVAALCLRCHTQDRDNNFDYLRKIAAIACPNN